MSFDNDPYRNMDVVVSPDGQRCRWRCQSCGGGWSSGWSTDVNVSELITSFHLHVVESHGYRRTDTETWWSESVDY